MTLILELEFESCFVAEVSNFGFDTRAVHVGWIEIKYTKESD